MNIRTEVWLGHEIRFVEISPNNWQGVANDVTDALGLKNSRRAIAALPEDQKGVTTMNTPGGEQAVNTVGELGIYQLIFKSRKKGAIQFQQWVYETIRTLRQSSGLEGFQIFRMLDKEHQREAMNRLNASLSKPVQVDFIKANKITNKAVSNMFGYPESIKKAEMSPEMLVKRQEVLDETVGLMGVKEKFGLDLSVSQAVYTRYLTELVKTLATKGGEKKWR